MTDWVLGLDLGKSQDYTALAITDRTVLPEVDALGNTQCSFAVRGLRRWPIGTNYTDMIPQVAEIVAKVPGCLLGVDATGVGNAVVELVRAAAMPCQLHPVLITAGHAESRVDGVWHVPKKNLVSTIQVLFGHQRLKISAMPERELLVKELAAFRVKVNLATSHESFEAWRESDKDDLVLATSIACWLGVTMAPCSWDASPLDKSVRAADRAPKGVFHDQDEGEPTWKERWRG